MANRQSDPRFYELRNAAFADREAAKTLITRDPTILKARNSIGETALHYLVVENDLEAVRFLANHGADPSTGNKFGQSAILEAAQLGYIDMVALLLRLGAKADEKAILAAVHERKREKMAAVLEAHGVLSVSDKPIEKRPKKKRS